jgi:hypothetical protein
MLAALYVESWSMLRTANTGYSACFASSAAWFIELD